MCRMMKKSRYNYYVKDDDKAIIFNSLEQTFSVMNKDRFIKLEEGKFEELDSEKILKKQGLIVDDDVDEEKKALLKYMKAIDNGRLELIILPTMNCNFRCPYCYENREGGIMSDETIDNIVSFTQKIIVGAKSIHVSWFGGEPLVALSVIEKLSDKLMRLARVYKKPYTSSMTTNGYLLSYEIFMKLYRKYHVTSYQITLDGRAQFHNKTRPLVNGGPTYETIMQNLKDIKEKCSSPLVNILLRSNLTQDTIGDLDNEIKELETVFGGDDRFSVLFKKVGDWGGDTVINIKNDLISANDKNWFEKLSNIDTKLNLEGRYQFIEDFNVCYAAKKGTYTIDPEGRVMRCTVNLESEYNNLGQITAKGEFIENESNYLRWQYPAIPGKSIDKKCADCRLYANCFGISCPINMVVDNQAVECGDKEKELMGMYKAYPDLFVVI